jgi:hypothetical protein
VTTELLYPFKTKKKKAEVLFYPILPDFRRSDDFLGCCQASPVCPTLREQRVDDDEYERLVE